jgi:predicted dehydrogenase
MRIALVGCGNIAPNYARCIAAEPALELVGAVDVDPARAAELVAEFGGRQYASLEELLADDAVELVVNLTAPQAHATVSAAALGAGKHVHSEKPVALRYEDARNLLEIAERTGVRLSSAPATLLGEAAQTVWKLVREGAVGTPRVVYTEANWGQIESWHPSPQSLLDVGPLVDVGVYPLAILTAIFGPARRVTAYSTTLVPDRVTKTGEPFRLEGPDFVVAALELESGVVVRLTASFYVGPSKQRGLEIHGDDGKLYLADWAAFDARVERAGGGDRYELVEPVRPAYAGTDWARALVDLDEALREGRPHRASGEQAAHLVEILEAIERSSREGGPVEVRSGFPAPPPMEWAR